MKSIYEDDNVSVLFQDADSKDVIVFSFCDLGFVTSGKSKSGSFWGASFFSKLGIPAIGFVPKAGPNWFPLPSMRQAMPHIRHLSGVYPQRISYGHSMGGYAALKHGALLQATIALSFCPQYSIDPDITADFDNRYHRYFRKDLNAAMHVIDEDLPRKSYILFDPLYPTDRKHVELIEQAAKTNHIYRINAPLTGHSTIAAVSGGGTIETILKQACLDNPIAIKKTIRIARRDSLLRGYTATFVCIANGKLPLSERLYHNPKWPISQSHRSELAKMMAAAYQKRGNLNSAVQWFQEWAAVSPTDAECFFALADCLIYIKEFDRALVAIGQAQALAPDTEPNLLKLASLHERAGFMSQAINGYCAAAERYSTSHSAILAGALFYQRNRMPVHAIAAFRSALKIQPRHELSLSRLLTLQIQMKDYVSAEKTCQDLGNWFPANETLGKSLLILSGISSQKAV